MLYFFSNENSRTILCCIYLREFRDIINLKPQQDGVMLILIKTRRNINIDHGYFFVLFYFFEDKMRHWNHF